MKGLSLDRGPAWEPMGYIGFGVLGLRIRA